jgi:hypothetical protein
MKQYTNCEAVGWVNRNAGLIIEIMHSLEKSVINFVDASIHRLGYGSNFRRSAVSEGRLPNVGYGSALGDLRACARWAVSSVSVESARPRFAPCGRASPGDAGPRFFGATGTERVRKKVSKIVHLRDTPPVVAGVGCVSDTKITSKGASADQGIARKVRKG